jgi:uroporphyrin-3 C-methyltransferase
VNPSPEAPLAPPDVAAAPPQSSPAVRPLSLAWRLAGAGLLLLALVAAGLAWTTHLRLRELEAELVKRQQTSGEQATEARLAAREAQQVARESAAKLALLEMRVAETSLQRTQMEELMQSVARSRDENVLADVEAALRVALQQSAITGSADPLVTSLKQAEERLARYSQPQLERVRRAIATDLERVKAVSVTDIATLTIRLDEAIRLVDELPLLARPDTLRRSPVALPRAASAAASGASAPPWTERWRDLGGQVWTEVRSLVRLTPIDQPEAMLVAPEQTFFLRENLKLRLLNARLALLSRQFDTAQSDLRDARASLDRYFDRNARSVQSASELVRQVMSQARLVTVPRPDATLAAITAATGRR